MNKRAETSSVRTGSPTRRGVIGAAGSVATAAMFYADVGAARADPGDTGKLTKIALEEHCIFPELLDYLAVNKANIKPELYSKVVPILSDFGERRLAAMDANGVGFVVLSISGPGVQIEPDTALATSIARRSNDLLAAQIRQHPTRYGAFAHLALQDPKGAADELERCIRQLGFSGTMVNGATNGVYLDDRRFDVFWERVEALGVPVYIHPANPADHPAMYADHPELWGPTWSWAVETCNHALRLIFSGVFDRYPGAKVILGHMGETLPIQLWRLDSRFPISHQRYPIQRKPSDYCRDNIYVTTAGVCYDPSIRCALDALGPRNVLFSIDYPYENTKTACDWIEQARLTNAERAAVAHGNARALLKLPV